jgi:hypothetical protein
MRSQQILRLGGLIVLLAFCGSITEQSRLDGRAPSSFGQALATTACPVTELVRAEPPRDPNADPFGQGPWYINADRSIWAGWLAGQWVSGGNGNKVLWIRPQGTTLKVVGRRLDGGGAVALKADIRCCYPTGFQASQVYFPTSGCWEVTATAGGSELKFVTKVR